MTAMLNARARQQLRETARYAMPRARGIVRASRLPLSDSGDLLYVKNSYAGDIPPNSFVMLDNSTTLERFDVTRPSIYGGRRIFVSEGGIKQGEYGFVRMRGLCKVLLEETERAAYSSPNLVISSVGMRRDKFTAFVNGPYSTMGVTAGATPRVWDEDGLVLIDFSSENSCRPFAASIANSGPDGEPDRTDETYWIAPISNSGAGGTRKVVATNHCEFSEYSTKKHLLPLNMVVHVFPGDHSSLGNPFWFFAPIPVVFMVEIVTASGSAWNSTTYTAKMIWYHASSTRYGPTLALEAVATVPAGVESSYDNMGVGSRCLAMYHGGSGVYRYIGPVNAPVPSLFYQAGTGGGNKIANYGT